jgi:hypothetical protein
MANYAAGPCPSKRRSFPFDKLRVRTTNFYYAFLLRREVEVYVVARGYGRAV